MILQNFRGRFLIVRNLPLVLSDCYLSDVPLFFALHISCVMVPIGQYTHQERGLNKTIVTNPSTVEVSITL